MKFNPFRIFLLLLVPTLGFSQTLPVQSFPLEAVRLHERITYFGGDKNRSFDIFVNNMLLKTVKMDGIQGDKFYEVDYQLPKEIFAKANSNNITVKFVAHKNSTAGGIYYVRLLK